MGDAIKGRGSTGYLPGRYEVSISQPIDDGWHDGRAENDEEIVEPLPRTQVREERARSIISRNQSPDIPFSQSVNPYRGCEHGCSYCFARPSHAYLNLSPGLDFETKLSAKVNAAEQLRRELAKPGYKVSPIALGINTDAYQPIERKWRITRQLLEVLAETRHPVSLITKNALIERDLDLLAPMARQQLVRVFFSVTSLDNRLAAKLEPRASAPHSRIRAIRRLHEQGVPVGVMVAPVIPWVNDHELEAVLQAARDAGADSAGYVLLRLPWEVAPLFRDWLQTHVPDRAEHVLSTVKQMRGGREYDAAFGKRMRGEGAYAELLARRFALALKRCGYPQRDRHAGLDCSRFVPPRPPSPQAELF
ncbi:DNA repair photolyase [Luteimonas cucumeris]|uniref:DNA repair photolyase n=1 Tax=Luteimonas cucumeris TaxID=985012 RepID=A0A562KWA4_9GAMM|nr:PA0069 family radical SAM protein [Luteimonas cucumeris]TWH99483.1 DNA repair photolyase [Luteimonas cucumeris]